MPEKGRPRRAIIYLYTGVGGEEAGTTLRLQEQSARQWADENGYAIDQVMADVADRTRLREALEEVQQRHVQAIAIPNTETLGGRLGSVVLLALNDAGAVLLSAKERMAATGLFNR